MSRATTQPPDADAETFDDFYLRTRARVALHIAALTGDAAEAHDHAQEAFVRAWSRWSRVGVLDDPEGWVRRVAYNLAVSRLRRARRMVLHPHPAPDDVGARVWDEEQLGLIAALGHLPSAEREAIVAHHIIGLSVSELAQQSHVAVGTIKSRLSRGRHRLAAALNQSTDDDHAEEQR